jgi:hypothetical protein
LEPHAKTKLPNDTHPKIEEMLIERYRQMTDAEKWQRMTELCQLAEMMAMADVRQRYPEATERECFLRVVSRRVSADLMRKAYGWDPDREGY